MEKPIYTGGPKKNWENDWIYAIRCEPELNKDTFRCQHAFRHSSLLSSMQLLFHLYRAPLTQLLQHDL